LLLSLLLLLHWRRRWRGHDGCRRCSTATTLLLLLRAPPRLARRKQVAHLPRLGRGAEEAFRVPASAHRGFFIVVAFANIAVVDNSAQRRRREAVAAAKPARGGHIHCARCMLLRCPRPVFGRQKRMLWVLGCLQNSERVARRRQRAARAPPHRRLCRLAPSAIRFTAAGTHIGNSMLQTIQSRIVGYLGSEEVGFNMGASGETCKGTRCVICYIV
jgi:hypothetical protein